MKICVVVGGGIIGTMHAYFAVSEGMKVVHVEQSVAPSAASVRNFGLIWVSGRAPGAELSLAIRARELWENIGANIPETGFKGNGSLTVALTEAEVQVLRQAATLEDADLRGFHYLSGDEARASEPTLSENVLGALRCALDAVVEPDLVLGAIRTFLLKNPNYSWRHSTEITNFGESESGVWATTANGERIHGDYLLLAPGALHQGVCAEHLEDAPLRQVRLQMAETENLQEVFHHSLADIDSLRYYPAFARCDLTQLPPQHSVADEFHMQLLLAQRKNGGLTIGDTHEYDQPFASVLRDEPYSYLQSLLTKIFGRKLSLARKWDGIYSQVTDSRIYFRKEISARIHIVTGMGGRGNTISPAVAEETLNLWKAQ